MGAPEWAGFLEVYQAASRQLRSWCAGCQIGCPPIARQGSREQPNRVQEAGSTQSVASGPDPAAERGEDDVLKARS